MLGKTEPRADFAIPTFPTTLVTLTIRETGANQGWRAAFLHCDQDGPGCEMSKTEHPASPDANGTQREVTTHVFRTPADAPVKLAFWTDFYTSQGKSSWTSGPAGAGTYNLTYVAEPLAPGTPPEHPAATLARPQVIGLRHTAPDAFDILAAWWDDASEGDGLFEAHLAIADPRAPTPANAANPSSLGNPDTRVYRAHFTIQGTPYYVAWRHASDGADGGCLLYLDDINGPRVIANPICSLDLATGVFGAAIPERSVGNPGPGIPYTNLWAESLDETPSPTSLTDRVDEERGMQFPFALGGVDVWRQLNPEGDYGRALPWYQDPLARENLPNTLQVAGALAAGITFLVGALAVLQRRRQTRRLLDRVDQATARAGPHAPDIIAALAELEEEFTQMFRRHRISEPQYQILAQRISSVATRLALRRELAHAAGETSIRIPVRDADTPPRDAEADARASE